MYDVVELLAAVEGSDDKPGACLLLGLSDDGVASLVGFGGGVQVLIQGLGELVEHQLDLCPVPVLGEHTGAEHLRSVCGHGSGEIAPFKDGVKAGERCFASEGSYACEGSGAAVGYASESSYD